MEKFSIYNDYLDGNLSDAQEQELLYELSTNDELRAEFRQLVAVNRSGSVLSKGYYVPESSTSKIFTGLGIAATKAPSKTIGILNILKSSPILMPVAVSIITAICIFSFADIAGYKFTKNENSDYNSTYNNNSKNNIPINTAIEERNDLLADNMKSDVNSNEKVKSYSKKYFSQYNAITSNSDAINVNQTNYIDNQSEHFDEISMYKLNKSIIDNKLQNNMLISSRNITDNSSLIVPHYSNNDYADDNSNIPLSLEVRNSQYWNIPAATISPSRFADFHNMTIDLKYNFDNGLSIGTDLRRETFFQKFDFVDELNQYTIIEQQPNFTTLSLNFAYNYDTGGSVIPFAQVSVGGNVVGAVSRLMAGASYRISNNFNLNISTEFSNLTYSYKNTIYNSPKFGINYGLTYNF